VTTWSAPERQYYRAHGRESFAGLLDQAAVLGMTVISASGDWGAHGGFPNLRTEHGAVCDALERQATFPGAEERVLSVGGTHVRTIEPWREVAWSARVSDAIARAVGLEALAGGGGFSETVPVPSWQLAHLRPFHPRSASAVAIAPHGRAQPDVSLMAWGPDCAGMPASYRIRFDGGWREDAGGTSVAAPIWAATIARLNEARLRGGSPRVGFFQPLLYRIADEANGALRSIEEGVTDIELPALDAEGRRVRLLLPGFLAQPGWDPATGLGVPDVASLEQACARRPP
jgi:kumamolisin